MISLISKVKDLEERIEVSSNQEVTMLERLNEYVSPPGPSLFFPQPHSPSTPPN